MIYRLVAFVSVICVAGCAPLAVRNIDARYGTESARDRVAASSGAIDYEHEVARI